ncbi:hypothetical protein TMatcc_004558 [Talaromyces marneffei ATCC 18224]|uniref:uncharacterized protein n=1 Tax=Talaromyces marneffei TaxID=37727 RepID=UPI0012A8170C|nr:uncharacterized protein EYB26_000506 [Talaromyces marneffei]QGA12861.1 hypothetical protein EYB26_000506 [Talaromyces marneffei]
MELWVDSDDSHVSGIYYFNGLINSFENIAPKLRSACDACHEAKVKCTGGTPCVHCKNHHHNCHYSFAARIGKPKGSRNRKTLARLREAAFHAAKYQTSCPTPPYAFNPAPLSVSPHSIPLTPDWITPEYSMPTMQNTSYAPYIWISPQPTPTPPENIDMRLSALQVHDNLLMYQQQQTSLTRPFESHPHSSQLITTPANTGNTDFILPSQEANNYTATWQARVPTCDCFHWQTSNLVSLHALKSSAGIMQYSTFGELLQYLTTTIVACHQTVACQSCEKSSSMMHLLIASLQMVFDHLEALLSNPHSEQQKIIKMMQIRHMLIKTQNTLKNIRETVLPTQQRFSIDSAISGFGEIAAGSSSDPDCLYQSVDKLQGEIGSLLSTIGTRQA